MTSRKFNDSVMPTKDPIKMASNYNSMLKNVISMINEQGPIYTTWIRFQVGISNPIIFDSTSTDLKQNLITSLSVEKSGAGVANSFTINIKYDPHNYGQNTTDKIEKLDNMIATAMSYDINSNPDSMRGFIQYGYNNYKDTSLVSPKYQFFLTSAKSNIDWKTGITDYTFEGISEISTDCDFTTTIPAFKNKNALEIVYTVLWSYYGKENDNSNHIISRDNYLTNSYNYEINISEDLIKKARTIDRDSVSDINPFIYCKNLLADIMSEEDTNDSEYSDLSKIKESQRPKYFIYMNDYCNDKCIVVNYISPKKAKNNVKLGFDFTWGTADNTNIVESWNPQTDLYLYLIQQAQALRAQRIADVDRSKTQDIIQEVASENNSQEYEDKIKKQAEKNVQSKLAPVGPTLTDNSNSNPNIPSYRQAAMNANKVTNINITAVNGKPVVSEAAKRAQQAAENYKKMIDTEVNKIKEQQIKSYYEDLEKVASTIPDPMYDAELTILGIPADIPIGCEVNIIPIQLESKSRTQGVYMIKGCTDNISNTGIFNSVLKLLRIRELD